MPAFAFIGAAVAASATGIAIASALGISAAVLGGIVAVGAAYVTSRIINGNANKGVNSAARSEGGRIQVAPATNNKIPVIYGNAYVNGMITDAKLDTLDQKDNNVMFYCIVLGETTNNENTTYGVESVYWNDLRLTALAETGENSHIVKDGRKVVEGAIVTAGSFVTGTSYVITKLGTTTQAQWNTIAGTSGRVYGVGSVFTAAAAGTGTGQAQVEDFIDTNFIVDTNQYVMMRVYAGGSTAADQIYPPQSAGNNANAYNFWGSTPQNPNGDGSWTSANEMKGLVFAIIKLRYGGDKGFTSLPNVTFQIANNVTNPADVWLDYMTSERYGAGIDPSYIDEPARLAWYNFCEEDISYTGVNLDPQGGAGTTNQVSSRYSINGVIDTSNQVKTNIDTILQNGGAWMSYNVDTGLWSPIIKKAVSAGIPTEASTLFTASRSGTTLTVSAFPSGRIEAGQLLYNSTGTYIGTISSQLAPTAGETAGQKGRYTTSSSGAISSTTFYTLPASTLEFSDDNIISGITLSSTRLEDLYNQVEVEFYNKYNKDQKAYFRNYLDQEDRNPNEPDNQLRMSLDLCNNSVQADILGQMELRQSRDDLVIEFTSTHYGIQAQGGDIIAVTSELYGWYPKYFRVMRVKEIENEDGSLIANIQALEYNPDAYTIEPITEFSTAANIGIGVWGTSPSLPLPPAVVIASVDADAPIPNFELQITVPNSGGPFDEIELYYTEGWDQHAVTGSIVPGTGSNGAPVGQGLLTVTNTTYGNINPGDRIDLLAPATDIYIVSQLTNSPASKTFVSGGVPGSSTSTLLTLNNVTGLLVGNTLTGTGISNGSFIIDIDAGTNTVRIEDAVTVQAAGTYTVSGGLGTYVVDTSTTISGTADLYDFPEADNYKILKKIVPQGNDPTFTNGQIIRDVITNVPSNSATYRRWFVIARMGIKKQFGAFSQPGATDFTTGRFPYNPNPSGSGGAGVFTSVDINNTTPWLTFSTQPDGVNAQYGIRGKSTLDDPWFIGAGSTGDDQGYLEIATGDNSGLSNSGGQIYVRQYNGATPGTGAPWFGGNGTVVNELILLDNLGDTYIPNTLNVNDSANISITTSEVDVTPVPLNVTALSTGTPVAGFGTTIQFNAEAQPNNVERIGDINWILSNVTSGSEESYVDIGIIHNGSPSNKIAELSYTDAKFNGDLTINYNEVTSSSTIYAKTSGADSYLEWNGTDWYIPDDVRINENLTVNGTTILGNDYITDTTSVVGDFSVTNNSVVNVFVDHATGYVGINDATPSYNLDVNGTANVETTLTVPSITTLTGDSLNITAFSGRDVTISTTLAADPVTLVRTTANTNASTRSATLRVESTGTPAVGFSNTLEYEMETAPGVVKTIGYVDISATSLVSGSETFEMSFGLRNGSTYATVMNLDELGNLQIDGDLTVSGNEIKYSTGTTQITLASGGVVFAGDIQVNGNDIKSSTGATAITLSGANVEILGDLTVTGNDIKSSGGTTAITLSGATVSIPSDLTVDSGTLKVDATNNRVGVNNASPTVALDVVGAIKATTDIQADSLTATGRIDTDGIIEQYSSGFGSAGVETQVLYYTATGNSLQTTDQWATVSYRTGKYTVSMRKGTDYHCIELMILHDGTTAYMTQYNEIFTNASLGTFTVDISGGNVRLRITPATVGSLEMNIERKLFVAI